MKLRFIYLVLLLALLHTLSNAQTTTDVTSAANFIKKIPLMFLPDTVQYSDNEFDYGYYEPEVVEYGTDSINSSEKKEIFISEFQNKVLAKSDSMVIPYELVKKYLLVDSENVLIYLPGETKDSIYPSYYFTNKMLTTDLFYCIVYEIQCDLYNQKYLCTLSKNGILIDKIKIASAERYKSGILRGGIRYAFFSDGKSIINNNLRIYTFLDGINGIQNVADKKVEPKANLTYQILESGKIKNISNK